MANLLDDIAKIKEIDKDNTLGSIEAFPDQLSQIWQEITSQKFPQRLTEFENIVLAGMGGSALAGRVVKFLFQDKLKRPFEIATEYSLPEYVNHQTLVIVSSYSGNTEETLSCLQEAQERNAKIAAITTGGKLGELIKKKQISGYAYQPQHNPLGFPKTAIGYSLGAILALMSNLKIIDLDQAKFQKAKKEFLQIQKKNYLNNPTASNPAKKMAKELFGLIPLLVASEHLKGAAYTFRNQIHEINHANAFFYDLPELTHELVEALGKPKEFKKKAVYLFIKSNHYHPRNQKRYQVFRQILEKLKITNFEYEVKTESQLAQALEVINLGGFLATYLSILAQEDPGPEPWIIWFKKKLGQPTH